MFTKLKAAWFRWLRAGGTSRKSLGTLTTSDFLVADGTLLTICSSDGVERSTVRSVGHRNGVISIRPLRWYERLRLWLKFKPCRNYNHSSGILTISQVFSVDRYYDEVTVVPNTRTGRLVHRFYSFLYRHQDWIMSYDADSLDIKDGEYWPKYSGSYWWFQPFRFANRFFPRTNGQRIRDWPEVIE